MAFPYVVHWRHSTVTPSSDSDHFWIDSEQPSGTHAILGGAWIGGALTSTSTNADDAEEAPVALAVAA